MGFSEFRVEGGFGARQFLKELLLGMRVFKLFGCFWVLDGSPTCKDSYGAVSAVFFLGGVLTCY